MFGVTAFLWETIPFFKYIIFPYRWLHITAFAAAFLSASVFVRATSDNRTINKSIILPALLFLSCATWDFYFVTGAPCFDKKELLPAIAVNNVKEHLPNGVRTDKIDKKYDAGNESRFAIQGGGNAKVVSWKSAVRVVDVKTENPVIVRFRTFNFPGWSAYLDGTRREIKTEAATGAILLDVPGGRHRIRLVFMDTPVRLAGKLISLATALVLIVILSPKNFGPGKAE